MGIPQRAAIMPSKLEEYLQKAAECEQRAQAAEKAGIASSFRQLAEYWRRLAKIVEDKQDGDEKRVNLK